MAMQGPPLVFLNSGPLALLSLSLSSRRRAKHRKGGDGVFRPLTATRLEWRPLCYIPLSPTSRWTPCSIPLRKSRRTYIQPSSIRRTIFGVMTQYRSPKPHDGFSITQNVYRPRRERAAFRRLKIESIHGGKEAQAHPSFAQFFRENFVGIHWVCECRR